MSDIDFMKFIDTDVTYQNLVDPTREDVLYAMNLVNDKCHTSSEMLSTIFTLFSYWECDREYGINLFGSCIWSSDNDERPTMSDEDEDGVIMPLHVFLVYVLYEKFVFLRTFFDNSEED